MRLECPHCNSRIRVDPSEPSVDVPTATDRRLHGAEYVCRECENELGVYHY